MYHLSPAQREGTRQNIHNVIVPSQHARLAPAHWLRPRHGWGAVLHAAPHQQQIAYWVAEREHQQLCSALLMFT